MAIAHNTSSAANSGGSAVASLSWSHNASGSDRLLMVGIAWTGASTTISVTHAGNSPTGSFITNDATSAYHSRVFYWVAPTTGAQNIVVTPSANSSMYGGATSFTGVNQTTPIAGSANNTLASAFGTRTLSISTQYANSMLWDFFAMANFTSTLTVGGSATQSFNEGNTTIARRASGAYLAVASVGTTSMSWTISGSTARSYSHTIIELMDASNSAPSAGVVANSSMMNNGYLGGGTRTWTHVVSGSNKVLVLSVGLWQDVAGTGTVSAASYNGVAMTLGASLTQGAMRSEIWYLINPAAGANTLSVTVTGDTDDRKYSAATYVGMDQSAPIEASGTNSGTGNISVSATTVTNNAFVQDAVMKFTTTAFTMGAGQTASSNDSSGTTTFAASYEGPKTPAGSVSMDWTNAAAFDWAAVAVAIKPSSGGGGPTVNSNFFALF